jgi:peptidoglycan-N-acetylglucosamine deacetylase
MKTPFYTIIILLAVIVMIWRIRRRYIKTRWKGERSPGIRYVKTTEKVCALTFDDGPCPQVTPAILESLKEYDAKATFFIVGRNAEKHPEIVREIDAAGHAIGNHTYSHARLAFCGRNKMLREVSKLEAVIKNIMGYNTSLLRPPYGRLMGEQKDLLIQHHPWKIIMWDICSFDWELRDTDSLLENILPQLKPGSIILLHDVHTNTAKGLRKLLPILNEQGYRCLTIPELLQRGEVSWTARASNATA